MTDIEMLPLPEHFAHQSERVQEHVRAYARANVAHATAAKDAEIEALRAEVERLQAELDNRWAQGVHTCHDNCQRIACVLRRENERLAEALRWYVENDDTNEGQEGNEYWLAGRDRAIAALRDHDQEGSDG